MDTETDQSAPDYDRLNDDLCALKCVVSPAEYHAMVTGRLVGGRLRREPHWDDANLEYLGLPLHARGAEVERILGLSAVVAAELGANDFSFGLLLPGDDADLNVRVEALGCWCDGFLLGLALAGLDEPGWNALPEELVEGLTDMISIARIEADEEGTDEDFEHLSEYVRMVVLNVYAQLMLEGEDSAPAPSDNVVAGLFQGRGRLH